MSAFTIHCLPIMRFDFKDISLVDFNHGEFGSMILLLNTLSRKYIGIVNDSKKELVFAEINAIQKLLLVLMCHHGSFKKIILNIFEKMPIK